MIRRLYVDNYRCLVNFELKLDELSLLGGRNGVGKSAVLDVIFAIRELLGGRARLLDRGIFPASSRTRWQDTSVQVFELEAQVRDDVFEYRLEVEHDTSTKRARIRREGLTSGGRPLFACSVGEVQLYRDDHSEGPKFPSDWSESALARVAPRHDNQRLTSFLEHMRKVIVCGLYPHAFAPESSAEEAMLARDGTNFASWYRHQLLERQELMEDYTSAMREVIDGFRNLRMERVGTEARALLAVFGEGDARFEVRLDELSDGQRALLALHALLHLTKDQGYTLFLDEPDNYVALAEIQPWLMELHDACGATIPQAVLCSHHGEVLDYFGTDHGIWLSREVTGVTTTRPLSEVGQGDTMRLSEVVARGWER